MKEAMLLAGAIVDAHKQNVREPKSADSLTRTVDRRNEPSSDIMIALLTAECSVRSREGI